MSLFRCGRLCTVSPDSQAIACPLSGRNSTYQPVQISGASSVLGQRDQAEVFASDRNRKPTIVATIRNQTQSPPLKKTDSKQPRHRPNSQI